MNVINENEALERTNGLLNSMILNDLEVKSGLARQCLITFFVQRLLREFMESRFERA